MAYERNIGFAQNLGKYLMTAVILLMLPVLILSGCATKTAQIPKTIDSDLVINTSEISAKAAFYPVEMSGIEFEVLAVKAPDGTIRTAFNTCQVCYSSGRGYYEQKGDTLVCQNCGNTFGMDQVEVSSGGCNPAPIFPENKTVDAETITIPQDYLEAMSGNFVNWKTA